MFKSAPFNSFLSFLPTLVIPFFLMACSPGQINKLPDDPDHEPLIQPVPGRDEGSVDLPSKEENLIPPDFETTMPLTEKQKILAQYDDIDPDRIVPTKALEKALLYFHENKFNLKNTDVISIIDFKQSSQNKRWYFINMLTGQVWNIHVAHGKGSDTNHDGLAEKMSNISGSNASSIGFYKTAETYQGKHGYSLRLDGLSETNSKARARAIVVHGADYVQDREVIQGRSWGCPAVSQKNYKKVIDLIKGGSLILAVGQDLNKSLNDNQKSHLSYNAVGGF